MKLADRRLLCFVATSSLALGLVAGCSDDDATSPEGAGAGGKSSSGAGGAATAGKSGNGTSGAGTAGSAHGGSSAAGSSAAGSPAGGAATGGAAMGGAASGGSPDEGGAGGADTAGEGGSGGMTDIGAAGGAPFSPINIPLLNAGFETGDNFVPGTVKDWQVSGDPASYVTYDQASAHSGYGRLAIWSGTIAYKVRTFQTVNGLTNGKYRLAAWVDGASTGFNALYLYVQGYTTATADAELKLDVVPATSYAQFTLDNIPVTTGTLTVGVYADAAVNTWANLDDITLTRIE